MLIKLATPKSLHCVQQWLLMRSPNARACLWLIDTGNRGAWLCLAAMKLMACVFFFNLFNCINFYCLRLLFHYYIQLILIHGIWFILNNKRITVSKSFIEHCITNSLYSNNLWPSVHVGHLMILSQLLLIYLL